MLTYSEKNMIFRKYSFVLLLFLYLISLNSLGCQKQKTTEEDLAWPEEVTLIEIESTTDGIQQPALFWMPDAARRDSEEKRPLLVALHSWGFGYEQMNVAYFTESKKHEWILWF